MASPESPARWPPSMVVMGVEGSGKSTVARAVADTLRIDFLDADSLHSPENRAKMAAGDALTDADRLPWLRAVGERLQHENVEGRSLVVACSALKRRYRDLLRSYDAAVVFVHLNGPIDVVRERITTRSHEFAGPSLLASQYTALEPLEEDEAGMTLDLGLSVEEIVSLVIAQLT